MSLHDAGRENILMCTQAECLSRVEVLKLTVNLESQLTGICVEILGVDENQVTVDANIFDLGAHSIQLATLLARIESDLGHRLDIETLWNGPSIGQIADHIRTGSG